MSSPSQNQFSLKQEIAYALGGLIGAFGLFEIFGIGQLLRGVALFLVTRWSDAMDWFSDQLSTLPHVSVTSDEANLIILYLVYLGAFSRLLIFNKPPSLSSKNNRLDMIYIYLGTGFAIFGILVAISGLDQNGVTFDQSSPDFYTAIIYISIQIIVISAFSIRTTFYIFVWALVFLASSLVPDWAQDPTFFDRL